MGILAEILHHPLSREIAAERVEKKESVAHVQPVVQTQDRFVEGQIRGLIHQVFSPGWPKPAKHVVFTTVDEFADVAGICVKVAEMPAAQVSRGVAIIEVGSIPVADNSDDHGIVFRRGEPNSWRDPSHQISSNLWRLPAESFFGKSKNTESPAWVRDRLAELRMDFDYTILNCPPAGLSSEAALLGQLSDGVVLVLEANLTRWVVAQKAKETIQASNARLLGTILSGRTFPVPDAIYRRI